MILIVPRYKLNIRSHCTFVSKNRMKEVIKSYQAEVLLARKRIGCKTTNFLKGANKVMLVTSLVFSPNLGNLGI